MRFHCTTKLTFYSIKFSDILLQPVVLRVTISCCAHINDHVEGASTFMSAIIRSNNIALFAQRTLEAFTLCMTYIEADSVDAQAAYQRDMHLVLISHNSSVLTSILSVPCRSKMPLKARRERALHLNRQSLQQRSLDWRLAFSRWVQDDGNSYSTHWIPAM